MLMEITDTRTNSFDIHIFNKAKKPKPSIVFDTYWKFASERQAIFFNRLEQQIPPWTRDPILRLFKFTNAYRASDRVSQYLIKEVIYKGDQSDDEMFFRILLFKLFNKIETWSALEKKLGEVTWKSFNFDQYSKILDGIKKSGKSIYSGAYIMASGRSAYGHALKHKNHLKLLESMLRDHLPAKIRETRTMEELYNNLKNYPTIGAFLGYQFSIDLNYSSLVNFSEMEFVKAGPGAKDGIRKCFSDAGDYSEEDIIKMMADTQEQEFSRLEIDFKDLWGRPLQLIDCQNLFCEVDKYSRVAHPTISGVSNRKRIKQKFTPTSLKQSEYFYPPKWKINTGQNME
jgi:hypothetical protein